MPDFKVTFEVSFDTYIESDSFQRAVREATSEDWRDAVLSDPFSWEGLQTITTVTDVDEEEGYVYDGD